MQRALVAVFQACAGAKPHRIHYLVSCHAVKIPAPVDDAADFSLACRRKRPPVMARRLDVIRRLAGVLHPEVLETSTCGVLPVWQKRDGVGAVQLRKDDAHIVGIAHALRLQGRVDGRVAGIGDVRSGAGKLGLIVRVSGELTCYVDFHASSSFLLSRCGSTVRCGLSVRQSK